MPNQRFIIEMNYTDGATYSFSQSYPAVGCCKDSVELALLEFFESNPEDPNAHLFGIYLADLTTNSGEYNTPAVFTLDAWFRPVEGL